MKLEKSRKLEYVYPMKIDPRFKHFDKEKLALVATLQEREIERRAEEIAKLRARLAALGESPETLFDPEKKVSVSKTERPEKKKSKPVREKKKQIGHGPTQQHLRTKESVFTLDDADKCCPKCGGDLEVWRGQYEPSDLIDVIEKIYFIHQVQRQKYRCKGKTCDHIETALGPDKVIRGGRYSLDFAVDVASQKYIDHMPLERQVRTMKRLTLNVKSQTLWDQIEALAKHLEPSYLALRDHILSKESPKYLNAW